MSDVEKKAWWSGLGAAGRGAPRSGDSLLSDRMRSLLSSPWPDLVGVDLSDRAVRVVHVARHGSRVARIESGERLLPNTELKPADRRAALKSALRDLVREMGLKGKHAAAAVSGNEVVIRRMALPEMGRSDLMAALALECRKHVNFAIEDSEIRYEIVGRSDRAGNPELLLSVCVAHRRRLDEIREALEEAGLRVSLLTSRPVALRALVRATAAMPSDEVVAYLDMGGTNTHITVLKGNDVRFSREFGVGGATLTDALRAIVVPGRALLRRGGGSEAGARDSDRGRGGGPGRPDPALGRFDHAPPHPRAARPRALELLRLLQ